MSPPQITFPPHTMLPHHHLNPLVHPLHLRNYTMYPISLPHQKMLPRHQHHCRENPLWFVPRAVVLHGVIIKLICHPYLFPCCVDHRKETFSVAGRASLLATRQQVVFAQHLSSSLTGTSDLLLVVHSYFIFW